MSTPRPQPLTAVDAPSPMMASFRAPGPTPTPAEIAGAVDLSGVSEDDLLARLERGERAAAEALVERTYAQVYAALVRLAGDRDLAADLTQETYRRAWASLDSFERRSRFGTWLYRIAYTTFLNHIRRPHPLPSPDDNPPDAPDPALAQDERLARGQDGERLRRAVLRLPDSLRFTVTARFWGERRVEDIAADEDITGAAVRKRLKTAYRHLRTLLGEEST